MDIDPLSQWLLAWAGMASSDRERGPVILMYHSVSPGSMTPPTRWIVSEQNFRSQMALLKEAGWNTLLVRELAVRKTLPPKSVVITFDDGYEDNYQYAFPVLVELGMKATWFVASRSVGALQGWSDGDAPPRRIMGVRELSEMAAAGMEIGAHSRNHLRLPELDTQRVRDEIEGSRLDLEETLKIPVSSFAYPYGQYDERSLASVRESDFSAACTTNTGRAFDDDSFLMRRVAVFSHDTLSRFARKLLVADTEVRWRRIFRFMLNMGAE